MELRFRMVTQDALLPHPLNVGDVIIGVILLARVASNGHSGSVLQV